MSLLFLDKYLYYEEITTTSKELPSNITDILIVPPVNNKQDIVFKIYETNIYAPIYEIHVLNNPVLLENIELDKNITYKFNVDKQSVSLYYKKEEVNDGKL